MPAVFGSVTCIVTTRLCEALHLLSLHLGNGILHSNWGKW